MRLNRVQLQRFRPDSNVAVGDLRPLPERVVQFGEGNFLRSFVDWMIDAMNGRGLFGGSVVVVQPIERGTVDALNDQDGLYTLILRGLQGGNVVEHRQIIPVISRGINPYRDWDAFLAIAAQPELRFAASNTTEAGIAYVDEPRPTDRCPATFPAKVAAFLHERYSRFSGDPGKGLVFLPCELIDKNGTNLRSCVLRHAEAWSLGADFARWESEHNRFFNTLVDRIVPGYPHEEIPTLTEQLGYEDRLLTTGEIFPIWVIEGDPKIAKELPLTQAGLNVVWTSDLQPRLAARLEDRLARYKRSLQTHELVLVSKSGLVADIRLEDFDSKPWTASFVAYLSASMKLRSEFTISGQQRAFDALAAKLLEGCQRREAANWLAIAHVFPREDVLARLSDAEKGALLGRSYCVLTSTAQKLQEAYEQSHIDLETMIVERGNDSSTWNTFARRLESRARLLDRPRHCCRHDALFRCVAAGQGDARWRPT